jgi:hypothetical protein
VSEEVKKKKARIERLKDAEQNYSSDKPCGLDKERKKSRMGRMPRKNEGVQELKHSRR